MQCSRLLGVMACLGIPLSAADAASDPVVIDYAPEDRHLRIVVPGSMSDAFDQSDVPEWLTRVGEAAGAAIFEATLTAPEAPGTDRGATDDEAFLLGPLGWLSRGGEEGLEVSLNVPAPLKAVATGALLEEETAGGRYTARFRLYGPPGQNGVFFGPYDTATREVSLDGRAVALRTHFKAAQAEHAAPYLDAAARHILRFDTSIGPYPYESFAVISAPVPVGYGLPGATYVAEQILGHPYMLGRSLAHEVLHVWWGAAVGVDYRRGNWAEGLTTYQADHALAAERDPAAAKAMRRDWLAALSTLSPEANRPVRDFVSAAHDRDQSIGYGKAAMIFHMLARRLGTEAFEAGLAAFYAGQRGEIADWSDLQTAFEAAAGNSLDTFFAQWLDRPGLPRIAPVEARAAPSETGFTVTLAIAQEGDVYRLEVPVVVETESGPVREVVRLAGRTGTAVIDVAARPISLAIDPDFDVARQVLDGELPPTLLEARRAGATALLVDPARHDEAKDIARHVLGVPDAPVRVAPGAPLPETGAILAYGTTDEISALRAERLGGEAPGISRRGTSRVWVEREDGGRLWIFASSDAGMPRAERMRSLRYYLGQSFVVFGPEGASAGRWPVEDGPMSLALE
jgi:hypothetical protein